MQHNHIALPPAVSHPGTAPVMFQQAFPAQAQQRGVAPPMQPQLTLAAVGAAGVTVPASAPAVTLTGTLPPPATVMNTMTQVTPVPPAPPPLPPRETHQDSNGNSVYRGRWTPDEVRARCVSERLCDRARHLFGPAAGVCLVPPHCSST